MPANPSFWTRYKDPTDVEDYGINWQGPVDPYLLPDETITTSTWTAYNVGWATTTDITIVSNSHSGTTTTVRLSSGITATAYYLTNHIVTSNGREKDETIKIICEEQ